jgi:GAF domain-containing protein
MADPLYAVKDEARLTDARTMLGVPLLREGVPIGVIAMARDRVEPFSDKEVELVSTFADQAVIAIENVRLLTEQREALEQQTATAEVLQVINSSPGNLTPVFEAVAKRAGTLCDADKAFIFHFDGQFLRVAATFNASEELRQFVESNPIRPGRYSGAARCALERRTIHIPDVMADPDYAYGASGVDPIRTVLAAPMLKGMSCSASFWSTILKSSPSPTSR